MLLAGADSGSTICRLLGNKAGVIFRKARSSDWFSVAAFIFLTAFKVSFMSLSEGFITACVPSGQN
jgi:hypothetical protein